MEDKKKKKLYAVANSHIDTQWNWTIQDTIRDCVKNTLEKNMELLDKYPSYHMNFEGAFRYQLAKEYYPDLYEKMKTYIAEGRWSTVGATWDAMDVNVPSSEALMRQVLYGNGYFEKEFGTRSTDIFLTDCFGFSYALPSIAAHMGLTGFSTQKLAWGVGSPIYEADGTVSKPLPGDGKERMDLGKWVGPDGNYLVASFLGGDYTYNFDHNDDTRPIDEREEFLREIEHNEKYTGHAVRSMYYGTGDYGGSCKEISAQMVEDAVNRNGSGLFEVVSASSDQVMNDLTMEEREALPAYDGELLIPHGSGALTSHTISKRWNRKNELLADAAERAAMMASWLGAAAYPTKRLEEAWKLFLWHQFHDDLPGTSMAKAYVFTHNDYVIALNMFASELENAVGGVIRTMDTNVEGIPVAVFNPVSYERNDVVCAQLDIQTPYVRVFDYDKNEVPAQISTKDGKTYVKFVAKTAAVSCAIYDVRESSEPSQLVSHLTVSENVLENQRYRVTLDAHGDIASICDKENDNFELLKAPATLEIGPDNSQTWPSWELVWDDALKTPQLVSENVKIEVADCGPAVVSLKVTRTFGLSAFEQTISLWDGGQRVDVANFVDWHERKSNLRAAFPMNVSNPKATFDLGLGAIESPNTDNYPYYQHLCHQWADLTAEDGSYGISILNDCKYGMDKPNDSTLRLTLIHTPAGKFKMESGQDWQDMGPNTFTYSIVGHKGFRENTTSEAAQLNQPMIPFEAPKHDGFTRAFSFLSVSDAHVIVRCIKKEEKGDRMIVRVQETSGKGSKNCKLTFASAIISAAETNGYEDELAAAQYDGRELTVTLAPYAVKTFAVTIETTQTAEKVKQEILPLPYDKKVTTSNADRTTGEIAEGISIPAELYTREIISGGVSFVLAPADEKNAVTAAGQSMELLEGYDRLYILAASAKGDKQAVFQVDGNPVCIGIQDYKANVGAWDMLVNAESCLIKRDPIAVTYTHTHDAQGDRLYQFAYLFQYALDIRGAKTVVLPEDADIFVMAATAAQIGNAQANVRMPLYDEVETKEAPCYKLTVEEAEGGGEYPEGRHVLLRTTDYKEGKLFAGWEGENIIQEDGPAVIVKMPGHDTKVVARMDVLGEDVLTNKPYKASSEINKVQNGAQALDGSELTKWCTASKDGKHWLEVDAGEVVKVGKWFVMHAGAQESADHNTRIFRLEYKVNEEDEWKIADAVTDNTLSYTPRVIEPLEARYFKLCIDQAAQDPAHTTTRIYMFQVYRA